MEETNKNTKIIKDVLSTDEKKLDNKPTYSNNKNQFISLFLLFFNLIKGQKWFFIISFIIYLLFSIFAIYSVKSINGFAHESLMVQGKIVFFLSIYFPFIILFISLPMLQGQISSSLLLKRIGAMGFGEFKYSFIILFTTIIVCTDIEKLYI